MSREIDRIINSYTDLAGHILFPDKKAKKLFIAWQKENQKENNKDNIIKLIKRKCEYIKYLRSL